jgi:phospholipid/cholesterol/gamma-HCH transport system substrate-binding protein
MKSLESRDPFKLGLAAIAVGAVLGLLVLLLTVIPFGKHTYTAVLAQSAGLRPKEDVQVFGVRVGEVRSVELAGDRVKVSFTVKNDVHLGSRTTAAVKVATLLGTHILAVTPSGSGDLPDDTIPLARTSVPFNLQDVLDQGTHNLEQLDSSKLATLLTTMTKELSPSSDGVGPALEGVVRFSDAVASRSDQIGELLTAARSVTGQLSASSVDLIDLMKQTNLVVSEVTARRDAIHKLLVETTRLAGNVNAIIADTKADTQPALRALNGALAELRSQDKNLRGVLETMAPAVRYLANATGHGPYGNLYSKPPTLPPNDGIGCTFAGTC